MLAAAFVILLTLRAIFRLENDGGLNMLIAGPALVLIDVLFRIKYAGSNFLASAKGGSFFFLPAWILGIVMLIVGAVAFVA